LERIGYSGPLRPSVEVLRKLHRRHLLSVPFENLDIHLGRPIILSEKAFYDKTIKHHRGGFCYELNGSFAVLHPWVADVGFGDSFTEPKRLDISVPQADRGKDYRFTREDDWTLLSRKTRGTGVWEPQYKFSLTPRKLEGFVPRCEWQQTSPRSHFRKGRLCTRLTSNGRLTLTETKFIVTRGSKKVERPLENPEEFAKLLHRHFGIEPN
jgi:N-hydroxyarylamine O-acetyltransferase